jgi:hypothetical protein
MGHTFHRFAQISAAFALAVWMAAGLGSCDRGIPPLGVQEEVVVPYAVTSVEQTGSSGSASITLKIPNNVPEDFTFTMQAGDGKPVALTPGANITVGKFVLRKYSTAALGAGQSYSLDLSYKNAEDQPIHVVRRFVSQQTNAWKRLPDAPVFSGDFTGAALLSPLFNRQLAVYRYKNVSKWDILKFNGQWESIESEILVPRHNAIAFPLGQLGGRELIFMGFGYIDNDKIPSKKAYMNDFWWTESYYRIGTHAGSVFPQFTGIDSDVKFFLTYDEVFMLKEYGNGALESMDITWDRKPRSPLPEATGKLVAFTIDSTGYVINQVAGRTVRLYAYSIADNKWVRKADFPGIVRNEGSGFSAKGKGYFGLGIDGKGNGLRDVWEYDPKLDRWKYHSEYPGQGNRFLIAISDLNKAYLGWGYETTELFGSTARLQTGCTDFWEFNP